jgi:hypothetical protein
MREDLKVWLSFLSDYNGITVMLDNVWTSNETIGLLTDRAGGRDKGFGIYFQGKWAQVCWPTIMGGQRDPVDITFLELFPVVISVHIWGIHLENKRIIFNVDNQAVVAIVNKKSLKSNRVMTLVKSCFTVLTI